MRTVHPPPRQGPQTHPVAIVSEVSAGRALRTRYRGFAYLLSSWSPPLCSLSMNSQPALPPSKQNVVGKSLEPTQMQARPGFQWLAQTAWDRPLFPYEQSLFPSFPHTAYMISAQLYYLLVPQVPHLSMGIVALFMGRQL